MTSVAVVAHREKTLGGGLGELRQELAAHGVTDPLWYEFDTSAKAPRSVRKALEAGADLLFAWGGDGTVQRCADQLAGTGTTMAILPAGTANLLASNLGIPTDLKQAVAIGLRGYRRPIDLGVMNGEHFAVMAGAGFDTRIMAGVDKKGKAKLGRLAYVRSAMDAVKQARRPMRINVDGELWFDGKASCVLFGNVGTVTGGLRVFPDARPDDGQLEIGVVTAESAKQWLRVLSRVLTHNPERSPMVSVTRGQKATVSIKRPMRFELDGGARTKAERLKVRVEPHALWVCVPEPGAA